MWLRIKASGQEVNVVDPFQAQRFIDADEAVAIKTPRPKDEPVQVQPAPVVTRVPISPVAFQLVHDAGLPKSATPLIARLASQSSVTSIVCLPLMKCCRWLP